LGTRLYVKPVAFYDADSVFNIFKLGFSLVSDVNAPLRFATDPTTGENLVEDDHLVTARDDAQTVWGMDLEAEVLHSDILDVVPYTDLNFIQGGGWGWHLGTLVTAKMPIGFELQIPVRLEYRRFRSDYIPTYFGTFYEVERYDYSLGAAGGPIPKAEVVRHLDDGDGINGYYADLAFDFAGLLQIGAVYEDYDKADPNLAVFLAVPALDVIQFKAYYTRRSITGTDDIFVFDDRSLAIAQARYQMSAFMYLVARFTRQWELNADTGTYDSVDSWNAGLEFSLEL
jgi:hypothetical protein